MEIKRKGIIFALDAALAVSVVIIILINSSYYFSTSSKESLSQLQPVRIGSDIIAILDYQGNFDYAVVNDLESHGDIIPEANLNVSVYLPKNYAMRYAITDMKETPVATPYCPDDGGRSNELCETAEGVSCSETSCVLDQNEWVKIKPFTLPSEQANILNEGNHFIFLGTTRTDASLPVNITVDGNTTSTQFPFDLDTGIYFWGTTNSFPFFELRDSPNNWITITNSGAQAVTLKWIRVVGDESYMRGSYSDNTTTSIPIDRFIGTGERFVSIVEPDGDFAGYHLVRYWIWLKTVGS